MTPADSLRPTLYDFLCYRAINILLQTNTPALQNHLPILLTIRSGRRIYRHPIPAELKGRPATILQIWQELPGSEKQANHPAFLATDLDRLNMPKTYLPMTGIPFYLKALQELKRTYINTPFVIEVMAKEANEYTTDLHASTYDRSVTPQQLVTKKKRLSHSAKKE